MHHDLTVVQDDPEAFQVGVGSDGLHLVVPRELVPNLITHGAELWHGGDAANYHEVRHGRDAAQVENGDVLGFLVVGVSCCRTGHHLGFEFRRRCCFLRCFFSGHVLIG